ncbi:MAG: glycoside hydrolase family 78 protein [Verrucomicrobia bacterium]|nr:glycoside hydrolase family 78 protein [Verrucomicrobiota bacterium]
MSVATADPLVVTRLRCEYLENPLAVDAQAPRLFWRVESDERGERQTAYEILVASSRRWLDENRGDLWSSGKVPGDQTTHVVYRGKPLGSRQRCYWKVRVWNRDGEPSPWSETASWTMGLLEPGDWQAEWISFRDPSPLHADPARLHLPPARHYRKEFQGGEKTVRRATLHASALGIFEAHLNGHRVSEQFFSPGWTDYRQRVYYTTFDVTDLVRPGPNALGAVVADGWYAGYLGYGLLVGYGPHRTGRDTYGKTPALLAQLEIEYDDGSLQVVGTDATWKVTGEGPYREADFLMGEHYDATRELPGWDQPRFDDATWENAVRAGENGSVRAPFHDGAGVREQEFGFVRPARLEAYPAPPVRFTQELPARSITTRGEGVSIVDLGQNFAGVVRLKVRGPAGTRVQLRFGEMLHPDGRLMTENLRKARATDTYVLRGDPRGEVYVPRFTFHGFQFVEVSGYPGVLERDALTGIVLHSDTRLTSSFACSDPMVNRLFENIVWTQRANFLELPTDCPQRDERFGWMGDAQIYARTATYNANVAAFFSKWLREVEEAQLPGGAYPDYCPWPFQHGKAFAPAWTDAGIIVPWTVWQVYGDTRVLERQWDSMTRFLDWRQANARGFLGIQHPEANTWGDWLNLNEPTPIEYVDSVYFAITTRLMGDMADALGRRHEAVAYRALLDNIRSAFAAKYLGPDGTLTVDTQSAYALALDAGLIPEPLCHAAAERLAQKIRTNDTRMATGFLGTRPLLPVLSAHGQHDLAARLLQSRRFPSWGYEVENGATTIWERWDSFTREHGFNGIAGNQNAAMNSFSHYSFGAVCEWMFRVLAGIDTATPGFRQLRLRPMPPAPGSNPEHPAISWARARYDSLAGPIASHWRLDGGRFEYEVSLPANTTATVHLPASEADRITEGGRPLRKVKGARLVGREADRWVVEVGSGSWRFVTTNAAP